MKDIGGHHAALLELCELLRKVSMDKRVSPNSWMGCCPIC